MRPSGCSNRTCRSRQWSGASVRTPASPSAAAPRWRSLFPSGSRTVSWATSPSKKVSVPEQPEPSTGKKVAVIGAGPAGLANAYYLALKGHAVTILEALPEPGGMLRYGIPEYRLPKQVLDAELEPLWDMGVVLKTKQCLGPDYSIDGLLGEQGYDALYLGIGAHESMAMRVENEGIRRGHPHG